MKRYKTSQREYLIDFFKDNPNICFTIEEILQKAKENGAGIGQTTIYRNVEKLVDSGFIVKNTIPDTKSSYFRYLDKCGGPAHYHFLCTSCGNIEHAQCNHLNCVTEHVFSEHKFKFDLGRTVFYGVCQNCFKEVL